MSGSGIESGTGRMVLNLILLVILGALIGLHWVILPDHTRRNYEFLPDMVESVPRDAQGPVPVLADGTVLDLRPPAGSVARGFLPLQYGRSEAEALRAGRELRNPFSPQDTAAVARGAVVFSSFCSPCHGAGGQGDGTVTKRGFPPPPSLFADRARLMTDGQMYHIISLGQGNMASYASQVEREDRWKSVLYIRSLQERAEKP